VANRSGADRWRPPAWGVARPSVAGGIGFAHASSSQLDPRRTAGHFEQRLLARPGCTRTAATRRAATNGRFQARGSKAARPAVDP